MAQELMSMTPLAEYVDMLYTRLAIEMPKHSSIKDWWVELHPPHDGSGGTGYVKLKAFRGAHPKSLVVTYEASMHSIEHGARVSITALETVVEHHIKEFVEELDDKS